MFDFTKYLHKYIVRITKDYEDPEQLSGIRIQESQLVKFKKRWVLVRALTSEDLKDEDFIIQLYNNWKHDEALIKSFLRYKIEFKPRTNKHPVARRRKNQKSQT